MSEVTRILNAIKGGDGDPKREELRLGTHAKAADELLPLVYEELRLLAARKLSHEPPGQTLQATALVHEAYLRLVGSDPPSWEGRAHFFGAAAEPMRRILVDNARRKKSLRRGGDRQRIELDDSIVGAVQEIRPEDLLALNDALDRLSQQDKAASDLIKLHLFGGLAVKQAAEILGISTSKAYADLQYVKAWLRLEMASGNASLDPQ